MHLATSGRHAATSSMHWLIAACRAHACGAVASYMYEAEASVGEVPVGPCPSDARCECTAESRCGFAGTVLVKWKGLDYDECTWEESDDIEELALAPLLEAFRALRSAEAVGEELRAAAKSAKRGGGSGGGSRADARTHAETPAFLAGGSLHSYQLDGLNWMLLRFRRRQNMILADEMGLGKTVQTIAMIASLRCAAANFPLRVC